jgi:hypothetical protein
MIRNFTKMSSSSSSSSIPSVVVFSEAFNPISKMKVTTSNPWKVSTPEERAFVKQTYDNELAKWRRHSKYSLTLTRHFIEDAHLSFRRAFQSVVNRFKETKQVDRATFRRILQSLAHHHQAEDEHYFPLQVQKYPETKEAFEYLELDHQHLHPLEEKVLKHGDGAALVEFVDFLCDHLNREEMLLVPFMLENNIAM